MFGASESLRLLQADLRFTEKTRTDKGGMQASGHEARIDHKDGVGIDNGVIVGGISGVDLAEIRKIKVNKSTCTQIRPVVR